MKVAEYNVKKRFSEASGSAAVVDDNIKMQLNEYGNYEETVLLNESDELDPIVKYVSPNLNEEVNETDIAKKLYNNIDDINYDKRIGYYTSLYAGYVNEGDYRENASSDRKSLQLNEYGNYEETVLLNESDELDPIVKYVSPNLNEEVNETDIAKKLYNNIDDINYDKRIGYYTSLYAGYVNEGDYRENASSDRKR